MPRVFVVFALLVVVAAAGVALATTTKLSLSAASNNDAAAAISNRSAALRNVGVDGGTGWVLVVDPASAAQGTSADLTVKGKVYGQHLDGGVVLNELGFDIYTPGGFDVFDRGSLCGTSTRFDFENSATGGVYSLSCDEGTHTDLGGGWTRVRYTDDFQVDTLEGPAWAAAGGFGAASVDFVQVLNDGVDGGGIVVLDNIDVNGRLIGS